MSESQFVWIVAAFVVILVGRTLHQIRAGVVSFADFRMWLIAMVALMVLLPLAQQGIAYLSKYARAECVPFLDFGDAASLASFLVNLVSMGAFILWIAAGSGAGVIARLLPAASWPAQPPWPEHRVRWMAPLTILAFSAFGMFVHTLHRIEPSPCEVSVMPKTSTAAGPGLQSRHA